jgi:hypothetical protein
MAANASEHMGGRNPYVLLVPLWKAIWRFFKKLKIEKLYEPAVPLVGRYLKECKSASNRDVHTPMFYSSKIHNSQAVESV